MQRDKNLKPDHQAPSASNAPRPRAPKNSSKSLCPNCLKPKAPDPQDPQPTALCKCGGGGGGKGKPSGENSAKSNKKPNAPEKSSSPAVNTPVPVVVDDMDEDWQPVVDAPRPELKNPAFDPEAISRLLGLGALLIHNNPGSGTLTIQLLYHDLTPELAKAYHNFVGAILAQLQAFQLKHGITKDCLFPSQQDKDGNPLSFAIQLPQALYSGFINQLAKNHLLPSKNLSPQEANEKVRYEPGINHFPTPFSTQPAPSATKRKREEAEAEQSPAPKRGRTK